MNTSVSDKKEFKPFIICDDTLPLKSSLQNPFIFEKNFKLDSKIVKNLPIKYLEETVEKNAFAEIDINSKVQAFFNNQLTYARRDYIDRPKNINRLISLALTYLNQKDYPNAKKCLLQAEEIDKKSILPKLYLVKVCMFEKKYDEALLICKKIKKEEPTDVRILVIMSRIFMEKNELGLALKYINKSLKIKESVQAYIDRALIYIFKKEFNLSISSLKKVLWIDPRSTAALNNLGICYALQKSYDRAIKYFLSVLSIDPLSRDALKNISLAYFKKGEFSKVVSKIEEYLNIYPLDINTREILARSYFEIEEYSKSLRELRLISNLLEKKDPNDPKLAHIYNNIGAVCESMNNEEESKLNYKKCLKFKLKTNPVHYYNMINLMLRKGNLEEAKGFIEECEEIFPGDMGNRFALAQYFYEKEDYDKSIKILHRLIKIKNVGVGPFALFSTMLTDVKADYQKCKNLLAKGLLKFPYSIPLNNNLAYNYLKEGNIKMAREILDKKRISQIVNNVFLTATRGLLLVKEGNIQEGQRLYNRARDIARNDDLKNKVMQKKNLELARYYLDKGNIREAKRLLEKALGYKTITLGYIGEIKKLLEKISINKTSQ